MNHLLGLTLLVCFSYVASAPVTEQLELVNIRSEDVFAYKSAVVNSYYAIPLDFPLTNGDHKINEGLDFKDHFNETEVKKLETFRTEFNKEIDDLLSNENMIIDNFLKRNLTVKYNRLNVIKKEFESIQGAEGEDDGHTTEKPTDKPADEGEKATDKPIEEATDKPADKDDKPAEKPTDKDEKAGDKNDKVADKDDKAAEKLTDKEEKAADKEEKAADKGEKAADKDEKATDEDKKASETSTDKPIDKPTVREEQLKSCIDTVDSGLQLVNRFESFQTEYLPEVNMTVFNQSIEALVSNLNKKTEQLVFSKDDLLNHIHQIAITKWDRTPSAKIVSDSFTNYTIAGNVYIPMHNLKYNSSDYGKEVLPEFFRSKGKTGIEFTANSWTSTQLNFNMFAIIQLSILYYFIKSKF